MSLRSTHLKLIGAAGAAALAIGTIGQPGRRRASKNLDVQLPRPACAVDATNVDVRPGTPTTKMVAGQTDKHAMSQVVHLDAAQSGPGRAPSAPTSTAT